MSDGMAQVVENPPSKLETLSSNPQYCPKQFPTLFYLFFSFSYSLNPHIDALGVFFEFSPLSILLSFCLTFCQLYLLNS